MTPSRNNRGQAARKLDRPERWVRYVITRHGPEPVVDLIPKPDHLHYEQRQLAPVADGILGFVNTSFEAIAGDQLELFSEPEREFERVLRRGHNIRTQAFRAKPPVLPE